MTGGEWVLSGRVGALTRRAFLEFGSVADAVAFGATDGEFHTGPGGGRASSRKTGNADWSGSDDYGQAARHSVGDGWNIRDRMDRVAAQVAPALARVDTRRVRVSAGVCGGSWDVARVLSGHPTPARRIAMHSAPAPRRVVRILANTTANASVSADTLVTNGAIVCALVEGLRLGGIGVDLWSCIATRASQTTAMLTRVASAGTGAADSESVMFALAHPSMLRRVMFAAMEHLPTDSARSAAHVGSGYGSAVATPEWVRDMVTPDIDLGAELTRPIADPVAWVLERLRRAGVVLSD